MNHTLQLLPIAGLGLPRMARAIIKHNLTGMPDPGKGNRARRRAGLPVAEREIGIGGPHAMTFGEFNKWMRR